MSGWLTSFLLGRPGMEYAFDVNPEAMSIQEQGVIVRQNNLIGDLKKSVIKTSAPIIQINSSYLTMAQRNQLASLAGVSDTFLSFMCRDDWQTTNELATNIDTTHIQIANSSATRLSAIYKSLGGDSLITFVTPFGNPTPYSDSLPYSNNIPYADSFDLGAITYNDATRIVTLTNPLPDILTPVLVTYTYPGWLVDMQTFGHSVQGGWLNRFQYDFTLIGA